MKVEYFGWDAIQTIKSTTSSLVSIECHKKIDQVVIDLTQIYLSDQSKAATQFNIFKSVIADLLNRNKIGHLLEDPELNDLIVEVEWIIEDPVHDSPEYVQAQLATYGKLVSARLAYLIISTFRQMEWLDPRDIIITDENWTKAEINFDFSRPKFEKLISSKSYLTTHGIGASPDNQNTLTSIVHYWDMFVDDKK